MQDYTPIYNKFVSLYCSTTDKNVSSKAWQKLWEIVSKNVRIGYYSYVVKKKIFRNDHDDMIDSIIVRLMERIKKWKDKGKVYTMDKMATVVYNEIRFMLHNEKQMFTDDLESLDILYSEIREREDVEDDFNETEN